MYLSKDCQHQILASLPAIFNEFIVGLSYGWTAPTLRHLLDNQVADLTVTVDQASWIGSLNELGRVFGPLLSTPLLSRLGRRGVMTLASVMFFVSFALIAFTRSVTMIYVSRMMFGVSIGLSDVTCTIYLSENMKPTLRGALGSVSNACYYVGTLCEFCLATYLTYEMTAYTNMVVAFCTLSTVLASTETPEYLIRKGRNELALKNFLWLRGDSSMVDEDAVEEFDTLKERVEDERRQMESTSVSAYFSTPLYRKTVIMVLVFCLLTNATGYDPIMSYMSIILTEDVLTPNEFTILFGVFELSAAVLSVTVIEKVNRRTMLVSGLFVGAVVHIMTTALLYLRDQLHVTYSTWWTFATITAYSMTFSSTVFPIYQTIRGELLPYNVRSFGCSVSVVGHALVGFLTAKAFLLVAEAVGMYWNFAFYAIISVASLIFVYFVLPETRGKSLSEIQSVIEGGK